jgi:polysaccharide chain length determinant protein (PEP-CTERM system associated)
MPNTFEAPSLRDYWKMLSRRRQTIFFTALVVWVVACGVAWLLPPRYRSEASILIQQPTVPKHYVLPNIESDPEQELQTLQQRVLSRSRLQRIIDDLHLYSGGVAALMPGDAVEKMRKDIDVELTQTDSRPPQLSGFTISYAGYKPGLVQQVASRLTSLFVEENLQSRQRQSENTTEFLDRQLQDARVNLNEQTQKVKAFKAQFVGQLPGELQSNLQILNGLQIRLQQANESLNRSEQQKLYLTSMLSAYRAAPSLALTGGATAPGTPAEVDAELIRLQSQLADMKSRYTDKHPAVLQVSDEISKAEKLKAELLKDQDDDSGLPLSRGVAEIKSQLKGADLDIQNRKKEIAALQSEMRQYENRLNETPVREQQLADLTRDYDQSRRTYEDLLGRKNDSAMATDLEKAQQGEQFAVLDSPSFPASPYFPNRLLVTLGGLAIGLVAGLAFAFTREALDDSIHTEKEVNAISKTPVLISIPPLHTARDIGSAHQRVVREVTCAVVSCVIVATSAVLAYYYG